MMMKKRRELREDFRRRALGTMPSRASQKTYTRHVLHPM